ncbi:hypothetical protein [Sphingomonas yabuuchiae]|uniref:Uncharacterized protein n=1 Tax=Sphingomonas yabuuchiae TaxID=172044 RepID=A0AA40ZYP6_9SPHN|nr:hypothetical protein [Sphingomonas yabuuchiae]MBB4611649.1 hypothetical protein [Sphingomonas yabuuchiae]MBN3556763.1 hypothetical protein [Sphingomonas yabuuchiae]
MDQQDAKDVSDIVALAAAPAMAAMAGVAALCNELRSVIGEEAVQRVHKEMLNRISIHQAPMGPKIAIQAELSKRFGNL